MHVNIAVKCELIFSRFLGLVFKFISFRGYIILNRGHIYPQYTTSTCLNQLPRLSTVRLTKFANCLLVVRAVFTLVLASVLLLL